MRPVYLLAVTALVTACGGGGSYGGMSGSAYGGGSGSPITGGGGSTDGGGGTVSAAGGADGGSASAGYVITISNLSFSPLNLAVPPGATIAVVNKDGMPHSVTSEARSGTYTRGAPAGLAPFDTGEFSSGQRTITIPANAPAGTVIPYYCVVHTTTMQTPNGTITVNPSAAPASSSTPTGAPTPTGTSTPGGTTGSGTGSTGGMGTGTGTGTNTGGGSGGMGGYGAGG